VNITSSYKSNQLLWLVLKLLTVILCCYFIFTNIAFNEELKFIDFYSKMMNFGVFSSKNIIFMLFFTIINHFLEIKKWKTLTKSVKNNSWFEATEQSLASLTFSIITPNRIGEYGAKVLFYPNNKRKQILLLNFAGNFYQLAITIILGMIGMVFLYKYASFSIISTQNSIIIIIALISMVGIFYFLKEKYSKIGDWLSKIIELLSFKNNKIVILISLLRYLVFSHQFYFLIYCFKLNISYFEAMTAISSVYLIASCIPILSLFDLALKGSVAIIVFSIFEIDSIQILSITTLMWLLNFVFPAIIGSYFVFQFNPEKL
jgi:hypothetical protein